MNQSRFTLRCLSHTLLQMDLGKVYIIQAAAPLVFNGLKGVKKKKENSLGPF